MAYSRVCVLSTKEVKMPEPLTPEEFERLASTTAKAQHTSLKDAKKFLVGSGFKCTDFAAVGINTDETLPVNTRAFDFTNPPSGEA